MTSQFQFLTVIPFFLKKKKETNKKRLQKMADVITHESRFLEASLVLQADGQLKNEILIVW